MSSSVVDYENLMTNSCNDANTSIRSGVLPRWERKRLLQASRPSSNTLSENDSCTNCIDNNPIIEGGVATAADRFIPNRAIMDMEKSEHFLRPSSSSTCGCEQPVDDSSVESGSSFSVSGEYKSTLGHVMLGVEKGKSHRVLSFKDKAPVPKADVVNHHKILYSSNHHTIKSSNNESKLIQRHISNTPYKILDAPELMDDYYLNLISWSASNYLAIALGQQVYIWNAESGDVQELCSFDNGSPDAHISSVSWVQHGGPHLAIGNSEGTTQLWDVQACKKLRSMDGHTQRVGALAWNDHILSSGGKDSIIVNHDVRIARHQTSILSGHAQEVCGLTWSPDGSALASGANDNKLCIWDASTTSLSSPRWSFTDHQAAVKALAWSPHERNLLASGGGTADRCIKFWNTQTGALLNSIDTGSQVCSLVWNPHEKEILSSHGFERNQLSLWKYPSMVKVKELEGHTARVLHMACSPDGESVVSASADETIRFWNVFSGSGSKSSKSKQGGAWSSKRKLSQRMHLR